MRNDFPDRETVERIRFEYPKGTRVALTRMNDPYTQLLPGDMGTVVYVDDIATIHVAWDKGGSLGLAYGEDACRRLDDVSGKERP